MNKILLFVASILFLLVSCQKTKETGTQPPKEVVFEEKEIPLDTMGAWVRLVMQRPEGVLRGFDLGVPMDTIKNKEKATLQEQNKEQNYLSYTFDVEDDFVDILYYFDEQNTLKAVQVNAVVNGVESFWEDFKKFYEVRYGKAQKTEAQRITWRSKKGYTIQLANTKGETKASIRIEKK